MQTELSGKYTSHSGKQTQALPRQEHQLLLHFLSASSYQYGKHLKFAYLHLTVAFFMLSNILKASWPEGWLYWNKNPQPFLYIHTDQIAKQIKNSFEHLIKTHPRNPTFGREVPKRSSSSKSFWRAMWSDLPTLCPVCKAKKAKQTWDICLFTGRQLLRNTSFWQIVSLWWFIYTSWYHKICF